MQEKEFLSHAAIRHQPMFGSIPKAFEVVDGIPQFVAGFFLVNHDRVPVKLEGTKDCPLWVSYNKLCLVRA